MRAASLALLFVVLLSLVGCGAARVTQTLDEEQRALIERRRGLGPIRPHCVVVPGEERPFDRERLVHAMRCTELFSSVTVAESGAPTDWHVQYEHYIRYAGPHTYPTFLTLGIWPTFGDQRFSYRFRIWRPADRPEEKLRPSVDGDVVVGWLALYYYLLPGYSVSPLSWRDAFWEEFSYELAVVLAEADGL